MERKAEKRQYHWMVAGEITFNLKQDDGTFEVNVVKQNCVIFSLENRLRVQELGKAQQTLQMQLFNKMGAESGLLDKIEVTNIVLLALMPLGHMTQTEFNEAPKGMQLREVAKTDELDKVLGTA